MGPGAPTWQVSCPPLVGVWLSVPLPAPLLPALCSGGLTLPISFLLQVLFLSLGA